MNVATKMHQVQYAISKDTADGQVLAGPLFPKVKTKFPFYRKQVINKSTRVIFGLVKLIIIIRI